MRPQPELVPIPKKRKSLFRPLRKGLPYAGIVLGILLFIFQASVIAYTENVFGKFLLNVVSYETQGRYSIEYSKVKFNIFSSKLTLTGFSLEKSPQLALNRPNSASLDIHSSLLSLEIESIWSFIVNKKLDIVGLEIIDPIVEVVQSTNADDTTSDIRVSEKIGNYLNQLKVEHLSLQHGDVKLTRPDSSVIEISDLSVLVTNFLISDDTEDLFSAENVEIELLSERQNLYDGQILEFDRLWLSLQDSVLLFNNLKISPDAKMSGAWNVRFPKLSFLGFDIRTLLKENKLAVDEIRLENGSIIGQLEKLESSDEQQSNLKIPEIAIAHLNLQNTDVALSFYTSDTIHQMDIKNANMRIKDIQRDSLSELSDIISAIDIDATFDEFSIDLVQLEHHMSSKNVHFNFQEGLFSFDSIKIVPNKQKKSGQTLLVPQLIAEGLNLKQFINTGEVYIDTIRFIAPIIDSRFSGQVTNRRGTIDPKNLFPLLSQGIAILNVGSIRVKDGRLRIRDARNRQMVISDGLTMELDVIRIDSMMVFNREQIFGIRQLDISFNHLRYDPTPFNTYTIDDVTFKSEIGYLDLEKLSTISRSESIDHFDLEEINIRGLDWSSLINEYNVSADSMVIGNISLISRVDTTNLFQDSPKIEATPNLPDSIQVSFVHVKNGLARLQSLKGNISIFNRFSTRVEKLSITKGEQYLSWSTATFILNSGPFSAGIMRGTHQLSGSSIYFDKKDSTLFVDQLNLVPISPNIPTKIRANIPRLRITGVIPAQLADSSHLHLDQVTMIDPTVRMELDPSLNQQEKKIGNAPVVDHLEIRNFRVIDGDIQANVNLNSLMHRISLDDWFLDVRHIHYDVEKGAKNIMGQFEDFSLSGSRLSYRGVETINSLLIGPLTLHSGVGAEFRDIRFEMNDKGNSISATIPSVSFYGENWVENMYVENYYLDSIVISQPNLDLDLNPTAGTISEREDKVAIFEDTLLVGTILLEKGVINLKNDSVEYHFPEVNMKVSNFNYQDPAPNDFYSDNIELNIFDLQDITSNTFNRIDVKHVRLSTRLNLLEINGLTQTPKYSKMEYGRMFGKQTDWMTLSSDNIRLIGFNFAKYLSENILEIGNLEVDSLDMYVFRDKNIPFPEDQVRYMPQQMLRNIDIPISLATVKLNHLDVVYEELVPGANRSGSVNFNNLDATMQNVTNDSAAIAKDSIMLIRANTQMLDAADVSLIMEYDLRSFESAHKYIGTIGRMDVTKMNKMLEPNVNVQVKSGQLARVNLQINGNEHYSTGTMTMIYNNLHIRAINKKKEEPKGMGPAFVTFFANTFVINRNNPKFLVPRIGDIYAERDTSKSVFNYLAKTALSGVVSSIGGSSNRKALKQLNKEAKEIKDKKRERMLRKADKKEQKQEKREDRKKDPIEKKEED